MPACVCVCVSQELAIIVHAFRHNTSKCIRCDPPEWEVAARQSVSFGLSGLSKPLPKARADTPPTPVNSLWGTPCAGMYTYVWRH